MWLATLLLGLVIGIPSVYAYNYSGSWHFYTPGVVAALLCFLASWWLFKNKKDTSIKIGTVVGVVFLLFILAFLALLYFILSWGCAGTGSTCFDAVSAKFKVFLLILGVVFVAVWLFWHLFRREKIEIIPTKWSGTIYVYVILLAVFVSVFVSSYAIVIIVLLVPFVVWSIFRKVRRFLDKK